MSEQEQAVFSIEKLYVKDLSLEVPHAPRIFLEATEPEVEMSVATSNQKLEDEFYEVSITVKVEAKLADGRYMFLNEVTQSGIFRLANIPEEAKKELVTTVKNITDTTLKMKEFQQEAKETLLAQKPKRATNPDDPDRLDENLALLTTGAKYQEWSDRFTMDVVPAMVTVLDIISTTHPDATAIPELQVMRDAFPQQKEVSDHAE